MAIIVLFLISNRLDKEERDVCFALIVLCFNELFVPLSCFMLSWVGYSL